MSYHRDARLGVWCVTRGSWVLLHACTGDTLDDGYSSRDPDRVIEVLHFVRALNPGVVYRVVPYTGLRN